MHLCGWKLISSTCPTSSQSSLSLAHGIPSGGNSVRLRDDYDEGDSNLTTMREDKPKNLHVAYTEAMKPLGRGHGFYDTQSVNRVRPGMCGYIDAMGSWNHIVDLTDRDDLDDGEYKTSGHLVKADTDKAEWSPMTSNGVKATEVVLQGGADAAGGVGAKVKVEYSSSRESGAVLLCNTPVVREGFQHRSALRKWGKANARKILENCEDVKEFGFHIVQTTWSSEDVYVNAWIGEQKGVSIAGTVRAGNAGEGTASVSYRQESSTGGWVHPIPMNDQDPKMRVLFFKGLHFKYRFVSMGIVLTTVTRGGDGSDGEEERVIIADPDNEAKHYEVEVVTESGFDVNDD